MTGLYLQLADDLVWEEVDQFTWDNWDKALGQGNKSRYTGNKVQRDGTITIQANNLSNRDLAIICRFCDVKGNECPGSVSGGFVRSPEFIRFAMRRRIILHEMHGNDYIARKTKVE